MLQSLSDRKGSPPLPLGSVADPPNASLTYWDSDGTDAVAHTVIVEITGNVTSTGNVLSMTLHILSPSGAVLPTKLYRASVFIDDFSDDALNALLAAAVVVMAFM